MSSFCGLASRRIFREINFLSDKVSLLSLSTCLTPSKLSRACVLRRWKYQLPMSCRSYMAVSHTISYKKAFTAKQVSCWKPVDLSVGDGSGVPVRLKSRSHNNPHLRSAKKSAKKQVEEDTDSDDEEDDDDEENDGEVWDKHFDEDDDFPERCKEIKKRVKSLRCDILISAGLATSRRKVEEIFLSSQLYHNGQKVLKIGKKAAEGDYIDVLEKADGEIKVKRVRIVKVEKLDGLDKSEVYLRCWRANIVTDQYS